MLDTLLLLSGNDIPLPKARLTIHQPTIKEIGYVGEEIFFTGCELLNFSKDMLSEEDQSNLKDKSDFEILMSIINDRQTKEIQRNRIATLMVLSLLFPDYTYKYDTKAKELLFIDAKKEEEDKKAAIEEAGRLNADTFAEFKSIIEQMFLLKNTQDEYNPQSLEARRIAEKLKEGHRQQAVRSPHRAAKERVSVFSLYISVLAVGLNLTFQELCNYTVYQLFDVFERYELKLNYDIYLQAKMAGAKGLKEAENWMKNIHTSAEVE